MYEGKTFETIIDNMLDRVLKAYPDMDTREGSVIYNALAPAAIEMQDLYIALDTVLNESFADTQSREFLIRRCAERGIVPDEATCAIRKGEFTGEYNVSDIIGEEFSLGQLNYVCESCKKIYYKLECETNGVESSENGTILEQTGQIVGLESAILVIVDIPVENTESEETITEKVYLAELTGTFIDENFEEEVRKGFKIGSLAYTVVGKLSSEDFDIEEFKDKKEVYSLKCTTAGKCGNYDTGDLIPVEYIEGLETAKLTGIITAGRDEEETEHLRQRYFDNANAFAFGGNIADYKAKVLSLSNSESEYANEEVRKNGGVGYVKVQPANDDAGTVEIFILDSDYNAPIAEGYTGEEALIKHPLVEEVQKAIDPKEKTGQGVGIAPIGHKVTVYSATELSIDISAKVNYQNNMSCKADVEKALEEYFLTRIKEWNNDENLVITIGDIYMCIVSVPGVVGIDAIENMTITEKKEEMEDMITGECKEIGISINSIPVLGEFEDGQTDN